MFSGMEVFSKCLTFLTVGNICFIFYSLLLLSLVPLDPTATNCLACVPPTPPPPATPPAGGPGSSFLGNPHQPSSSLSWQGSQLTLWPFSNGIQKPGSTSRESQSVKKHLRFSRPSDFLLDTCKLPFLGFFLNCFNICFYENI